MLHLGLAVIEELGIPIRLVARLAREGIMTVGAVELVDALVKILVRWIVSVSAEAISAFP